MNIRKRDFLKAVGGLAAAGTVLAQEGPVVAGRGPAAGRGGPAPVSSGVQSSSVDYNYKPRRLNKVIELWEANQPIYYTGAGLGPGVDPYAQGVRMARTYADAVTVDFEHGAMDFTQLREFMRGIKDGGPTRSGHATPCVFVTSGIIGLDESYARANTWIMTQFLDAGVHGVHICHARDPKAIEVLAQEGCRYPFLDYPTPKVARRGLRGSSAGFAAQIWGMGGAEYCAKADLWPLNPNGELIFGVKIEDTIADLQVEKTLSLPGIAFAEGGGGDHGYWVYGLSVMNEDGTRAAPAPEKKAEFDKAMATVIGLCKKYNVRYLAGGSTNPDAPNFVHKVIDSGQMVIESGEDVAIMGREYSKRKMPV